MSTLTEFLLARIAEDAGRAADVHHRECRIYVQLTIADCSCDLPARVLAECEAKRQIVAIWDGAMSGLDDRIHDLGSHSLRALALPHVDHPDYDEEWKP